MSWYSSASPPAAHWLTDAPSYVRGAFSRYVRAARVLRLYERRGWNPSAVRAELRRAEHERDAALERWDHDELNPRLF